MVSAALRIAAAAVASPLSARAGLLSRAAEAPPDAGEAWHLLGAVAPTLLWGLPLAYVVFKVVAVLPRDGGAQRELEPPREATLADRTSLHADSREGW